MSFLTCSLNGFVIFVLFQNTPHQHQDVSLEEEKWVLWNVNEPIRVGPQSGSSVPVSRRVQLDLPYSLSNWGSEQFSQDKVCLLECFLSLLLLIPSRFISNQIWLVFLNLYIPPKIYTFLSSWKFIPYVFSSIKLETRPVQVLPGSEGGRGEEGGDGGNGQNNACTYE
jgi:hypothetical protein